MGRPRNKTRHEQEHFGICFPIRPYLERGTALITCTAKANYIDGENMAVIKDAFGNTYTFEADPAGDGATGTAVDISGSTTAADVGTVLYGVLAASGLADSVSFVDNLDGTISLTHKHAGNVFNTTITENVANAGHTVAGFTGGQDREFTATDTLKLMTAARRMRIDQVEFVLPDGFTEHATNFWDLELKKDSTVVAEYSTDSADEGTVTADTLTDMTLSATDANLVVDATDVLSLVVTKNASAADLPPGQLFIHGRYV